MRKQPESLTDGLKAAIVASGITQTELARLAGVHQPDISSFVNGRRTITLAKADRLAKALGVRLVFGGGSSR